MGRHEPMKSTLVSSITSLSLDLASWGFYNYFLHTADTAEFLWSRSLGVLLRGSTQVASLRVVCDMEGWNVGKRSRLNQFNYYQYWKTVV